MTRQEILRHAHEARIQEVLGYQINIDNYRLAIEHIEACGDKDLNEFKEQLSGLLVSEILEQKKAKVMLSVIERQLQEG